MDHTPDRQHPGERGTGEAFLSADSRADEGPMSTGGALKEQVCEPLARAVYIKTYGCQMNVYDSEKMADALKPLGYRLTGDPAEADLVLVNTCHVREKAEEKLYSDLGRLTRIKHHRAREGRSTALAVAGCVAQAHGAEIVRRVPSVDMVLGPQSLHKLPEMVMRFERSRGGAFPGAPVVQTAFEVDDKFDTLPVETSVRRVSAFLTVQEGCDKFCTFCCVPYTRGPEYSRPLDRILEEARALAASGTREITLLGQNVNAWHGEDTRGRPLGLGDVLRAVAGLPGIRRVRYMTSHPCDVDDSLLAAHREVPEVMPFVHLPVQSGSDRMLQAMNRRHTADAYRKAIDRFRQAAPGVAFSSDFIVGFPGETDDDFRQTLALVDDVGYAQAFSFRYSPRPGTPAALLDPVPEAVQSERLAELQARLAHHQHQFNKAWLGHDVEVLLEQKGKHPGQLMGKTPHGQSVFTEGPTDLLATFQTVRMTAAWAQSLQGDRV
jgi:tRNA-2-methylthio-N6-dimethylallyladenosine synthase